MNHTNGVQVRFVQNFKGGKLMKKYFPIVLSCICAAAIMTGCGKDNTTDNTANNNNATNNGTENTAPDTTGTRFDIRGFMTEAVEMEPFEKGDTLDLTQEENAKLLGIDPADIEEGYVERTSDTARADEIIVIKAKEGKADIIKAALQKYGEERHNTFTEDMKDLLDISNKREIVSHDNYIVMITSPKVTEIKTAFENKFTENK